MTAQKLTVHSVWHHENQIDLLITFQETLIPLNCSKQFLINHGVDRLAPGDYITMEVKTTVTKITKP